MCWLIDRYDIDPGGQAIYHDGHKLLFPYSLITVEYGILTIKKTVKTLQVGLYSFILNVSIKKKYNKKKKFLEVTCILVDAKYFWFLLFANTRHYHELLRVKH